MKIIKASDINTVQKPEGVSVKYYLFKDYEVMYNEQQPKTTQTWHHHDVISETLYIIEGQLKAQWKSNGETFSQIIESGDLVESEKSPHTFTNETDKVVKFLVIKRMSSDQDFSEIFKTDKILD